MRHENRARPSSNAGLTYHDGNGHEMYDSMIISLVARVRSMPYVCEYSVPDQCLAAPRKEDPLKVLVSGLRTWGGPAVRGGKIPGTLPDSSGISLLLVGGLRVHIGALLGVQADHAHPQCDALTTLLEIVRAFPS